MRRTPAPPCRILLIDDQAVFRETLAALLRRAGHHVVEAESGSTGIACLRREPLDLVLTDRDMPGLTGWDVALLVKAMHPRLPVVLVTGGTEGDAAPQGVRDQVDAFLRKPFPFPELLALIARMAGGASAPLRPGNVPYLCSAIADPA
jgi:CheY-like chemotaxis protein